MPAIKLPFQAPKQDREAGGIQEPTCNDGRVRVMKDDSRQDGTINEDPIG